MFAASSKPWNNVDIRRLNSNELAEVVEKVSTLSNVRCTISTREECTQLDKIFEMLSKPTELNELVIFFDETFDDYFVYYLYISLKRGTFKVSYTHI